MMSDERADPVAKVRLIAVRDGASWSLMSRKRADGTDRHGLLELLGGHLEIGESPTEALLRELGEEERTGTLARYAADRSLEHATEVVDGAPHHLFEIRIPSRFLESLEFDPEESLGFELVRTRDLDAGELTDRLTWRTQQILVVFGPSQSS